jgi:MEMO1 family protein
MGQEAHPLVELAYRTITAYILEGCKLNPPAPEELTPEMRHRAGVFVSLHEFGELRGCIGTFAPRCGNVAEEIVANAIAAATQDPRFPPVLPDELDTLAISVDVLSTPELVRSLAELDPQVYGVIVTDEQGARSGVLLPALEGIDTALQQLATAWSKSGLGPDEPVQIYRFRVKRYH